MPDDLSSLLSKLKAADAAARLEAAEALTALSEAAAPAAVALALAAGDEDDEVREAAVGALEGLGPPPASQLSELTGLLNRPQGDTAYWAATLLGRLGSAGAAAVPALMQTLGPAAAIEVRQRAAWALGQIGPPASAAMQALEMAAQQRDPRLARLAGEAIAAIRAK